MSSVFRRLRSPTGLEFMDLSVEIHVELLRFMMREENVPKRYRFIYTIPVLACETIMRVYITQANSIFPTTEEQIEERKRLAQKAISFCEVVIRLLQDMVFGLDTSGNMIDKLDHIGEMLLRESELLRAWRKSTRIIKNKE